MNHKKTTFRATRRQFLATASAAAACTLVPRCVLGGPKFVAPSEKINIGLVGAGRTRPHERPLSVQR